MSHTFYQPVSFPLKFTLSIDSIIDPSPCGVYVVIAHLLPPGGLHSNEKTEHSYYMCCVNNLTSETWYQQFDKNEGILSIDLTNIEQASNSLILFEIVSLEFKLRINKRENDDFSDTKIVTLGCAVLPLIRLYQENDAFLNQGHFQLPIFEEKNVK